MITQSRNGSPVIEFAARQDTIRTRTDPVR
jgi:hypothetical protein